MMRIRLAALLVLVSAPPFLVPSVFAQTPPNITPALDYKLASFYLFSSTDKTIDQKIQDATIGNGGRKPTEITIEKDLIEKFVDHGSPLARSTGISPLLLAAVANSNLIVTGTPIAHTSLPIENRTFIFTEYTIRIDKVFKDVSGNVRVGDLIIVARPGGSLVIDGVTVKAIEPAFDQFTSNMQYIFSLKSIRGTPAYNVIAPWTFAVEKGMAVPASKKEVLTQAKKPISSFSHELEEAIIQR